MSEWNRPAENPFRGDWARPNEEMHGKQKSCPKCELEFSSMLHPFCRHKACPVREYTNSMRENEEQKQREREMDFSDASLELAKLIRTGHFTYDEEVGLAIQVFCDSINDGESPRMSLALAKQSAVDADEHGGDIHQPGKPA